MLQPKKKILDNDPFKAYRWKDHIPGTNKVRTYCPATHLYSGRFSSIDFISSNQYRPKKHK